MAYQISDQQARYLRLSAQRLVQDEVTDSSGGTEVVIRMVGIQAQEEGAAYLSIHSRSVTTTTADLISHALLNERSLIRSWFMRGTLHLVARDDLDWLLGLLAPMFIKKNQRRYEELGLEEASLSLGVRIIDQLLTSKGPMTRYDLAPHLARQGVNTEGQALIYLINRAAWEGILCLVPNIGGKQAYVSLRDWIGRDLVEGPQGGVAALAERYLAAYGPAGVSDFAAWSGLSMKLAKKAWKELDNRLVELEYPGGGGVILSEKAVGLEKTSNKPLGVRLLPKFDTFLLGYDDRSLFVSVEHLKRINAGGGILRPILLVNGRVRGTWRLIQNERGLKIDLEPFSELSSSELYWLGVEIESLAGFLETDVEYQLSRV
jgi:hypothetical protein